MLHLDFGEHEDQKMGSLQSALLEISCPQAIKQNNELQPPPGSQYVISIWTLNKLQTNIIKTNQMSCNLAHKTCADEVEV